MARTVKVAGFTLAEDMQGCPCRCGVFFLISGTVILVMRASVSTLRDVSTHPVTIVGAIFFTVGVLLMAASIGICLLIRSKHRNSGIQSTDNPGRVINQNPAQPTTYPEQPTTYPGQPATYPGQPSPNAGQPMAYPGQPATYSGQPTTYADQPATYPGQPSPNAGQPMAYPGQPATYPGQPMAYPGQLATYPGQPSPNAGQPLPTPGQPGLMTMNYQYIPPGQPAAGPGCLAPVAGSTIPAPGPSVLPSGGYPAHNQEQANPPAEPLPQKGAIPGAPEYQPPPAFNPTDQPPPYMP